MRRKIAHVILFLWLNMILSGILTGCGNNSGSENQKDFPEKESFIEALPEEDIMEEDIEKEGIKKEDIEKESVLEEDIIKGDITEENIAEEELDWITLEEVLRPSVLQITCGGYRGSGVVWEITEEEVMIVSTGHLLKYGETCEVECYAGIYYEAEVERVLEDCDIGFAVFSAKALQQDEVELTAVIPCGRNKEELIQGEELAVYGSMDYVAGNFVKGYLIEAEREMRFEEYESAEGLLLGGILQEGAGDKESKETQVKGMIDAGMSGSGVFDRQGRLLGILVGGDGKEGFAAVPVWKFAGK